MDSFTDRLSEYLDDELTDGERAAVDAHLSSCADCRQMLAELRDVVQRAASLTTRPPQTDLWSGIAARLEPHRHAAVVSIDRFRARQGEPDSRRRFSFTAAQLAAAAVLLVVTSAGLSWLIQMRTRNVTAPNQVASSSTTPVSTTSPGEPSAAIRLANFADVPYDAAVADLQRALKEGRGRLDPKTVDVLEKNLAIIDQAIDQARQALASDPANTYLNAYLADARRRKLDLLRDAASALANLSS